MHAYIISSSTIMAYYAYYVTLHHNILSHIIVDLYHVRLYYNKHMFMLCCNILCYIVLHYITLYAAEAGLRLFVERANYLRNHWSSGEHKQ